MSIELARHRMGWHCSASAVGCGFNAARAHSSWPALGVRLKKPCPAVLLRDGQGRHAVIKKMGYHWHLRKLMADQQMFQTSDLALLLAERGVVLSREQDARPRVAGHQRPQHRHDRSRGQPASDRHQRPLRSSPGHSRPGPSTPATAGPTTLPPAGATNSAGIARGTRKSRNWRLRGQWERGRTRIHRGPGSNPTAVRDPGVSHPRTGAHTPVHAMPDHGLTWSFIGILLS